MADSTYSLATLNDDADLATLVTDIVMNIAAGGVAPATKMGRTAARIVRAYRAAGKPIVRESDKPTPAKFERVETIRGERFAVYSGYSH